MSSPIKAEINVDDVTQDLWRLAESLLRPAKTPSETKAMNPGAGRENECAPAKPLVVRTLKEPPEIWELVNEAPRHFNPGGAFFTRLISNKTNLILLALAVIVISGLSAFAVMTLRDGQKHASAAAQVQEERGASQTVPASQASAAASAPNAPVNAPANTQLNTQLDTPPSAEDEVNKTPPQPSDPQTTEPHVDNPVSGTRALTNSLQPTGVSVNNSSERTASLADPAALPVNKRVRVAVRQHADKSRPARGDSETAAGDMRARSQKTLQKGSVRETNETASSDSASTTKGSNKQLTPQLIAPPPTSSAPKAKVIQWP